jgi:hypothetical protein
MGFVVVLVDLPLTWGLIAHQWCHFCVLVWTSINAMTYAAPSAETPSSIRASQRVHNGDAWVCSAVAMATRRGSKRERADCEVMIHHVIHDLRYGNLGLHADNAYVSGTNTM